MTSNKQHTRHHWLNFLPRQHLLTMSSAMLLIVAALFLTPEHQAEANRHSIPVAIELETAASTTPAEQHQPEADTLGTAAINWQEVTVKSGDSLSKVFKRVGLGPGSVHELTTSSKQAQKLKNIYPGQKLAFDINQHGQLQALKHIHNRLESTVYQRTDQSFEVRKISREPEFRPKYASAEISSSLYKAAMDVTLDDNLIMEMANIFGGVIDFVYDVRKGDSFNLLFEEKYLDGEFIGYGDILAAQYTNQGETHTAYRYQYENGDIGYYTPEGISMRKAFLRSPVDFTRISSSFNLKRLHPIFKTTKPHRGIDYAAPRGTPVYSAGDGRVVKAGYNKANGNYVVIQHGQQYTTKYIHLHKRSVRKGQKVKQRQIIGSVGSTGYATGPHLHYEFLVNGVHRNPRTIIKRLPKAKSITDQAEKSRFLAQISGLQIQLAAYNNHHQLAKADQAQVNASL
jgi:murein DD-endopeptidase MepM/ murein hydrolase activator NlpD